MSSTQAFKGLALRLGKVLGTAAPAGCAPQAVHRLRVVSGWDLVEVHRRATSTLAAQFLGTLQQRMPFPLRALQVDGGSELAAAFEQPCQQRGCGSSYYRRVRPS